jgi:hypothetical protein
MAGPAKLPKWRSLTETEKINLLHHHWNDLGRVAISLKMKRPERVIRTFVKTYEKHGAFFPRRGKSAAPSPATSVVDAVIYQFESNRKLGLRRQTLTLGLNHASCMNRTL